MRPNWDAASFAVQVAIFLVVAFYFAVSYPRYTATYKSQWQGGELSDGKTIVSSR